MRTEDIFVLILIRIQVASLNMFKPASEFIRRSKAVLLFWIFLLFMVYVCLYFTGLSVLCSLVVTCLERDDLLALLCVLLSCVFVTLLYDVSGWVLY